MALAVRGNGDGSSGIAVSARRRQNVQTAGQNAPIGRARATANSTKVPAHVNGSGVAQLWQPWVTRRGHSAGARISLQP